MTAGDEQQKIREIEIPLAQHRRQGMGLEMIDRDQRLAARKSKALGGHQSDHHPADQARTGGGGDRVDIGQLDLRFGQS